jgi:alpha-L-rhamnosidase
MTPTPKRQRTRRWPSLGARSVRSTMSRPLVTDLRCDRLVDPLGHGNPRPALSWRTETEAPNWVQATYQIAVIDTGSAATLWDSGKVGSSESVAVPYAGPALASRQACEWRVRVWGGDSFESAWSAPARIEIGLLGPGDWTARFITPDWDEDTSRSQPCPYMRRRFELDGQVARARLYITALGVYQAEINGMGVGDEVLRPGWTSYRRRLCYQTHDVTPLLRPGENVIGVVLADGWARGNLGFRPQRNRYTDRLALLAQLEVTLTDGSQFTLASDDSWRAVTGPLLASDLYNGETYDARLEIEGWSEPGLDDDGWSGVRTFEWETRLVAPVGPPVRRIETIAPIGTSRSPSGKPILDFGQNLVGRLRLRVRGGRATEITLRHAEVLDNGELFTRALRLAEATDRYISKGGEEVEEWEPAFTFHGFRYAEVSGWPGEIHDGDIVAVVLHSDMERTGLFECSNDDINRLHENVAWSLRGNFLDIPTDCPQRSERLGWTGDIQVFAPTACLLYDVSGVLQSWLADLAADQFPDGGVPAVIPDIVSSEAPMTSSAAGWADAAVIVPWTLYRYYGDRRILESQYASMRAWVEHVRELAGEPLLWDSGFQFGDWLDPAAPPDKPYKARADRYLVATAYFARSTEVLSHAAAVLGLDADERAYAKLARGIKGAFRARYAPDGLVSSTAQAEIVLALEFDLLPPEQEGAAAARLVELIEQEGFRLGTGFLGTPGICPVLSEHGRDDVAYALLLQRECPSWLYPITRDATTIWERWDAIMPDGSINPGEMLSFNHYAYGAVAAWLYGVVAGLQLDDATPGWRRFKVQPRPGGGLTAARARVATPYGTIESSWRLDSGRFSLQVTVPPNTMAEVSVPQQESIEAGSGTHSWNLEMKA